MSVLLSVVSPFLSLSSSGGLQHRYTRTGGARPCGVASLVAGFGEDTLLPSVFRSEPSGAFAEWSASAVGKGSDKVRIPRLHLRAALLVPSRPSHPVLAIVACFQEGLSFSLVHELAEAGCI